MVALCKPFQAPIIVDVLTHIHCFVIATQTNIYISAAELSRSLRHPCEFSEQPPPLQIDSCRKLNRLVVSIYCATHAIFTLHCFGDTPKQIGRAHVGTPVTSL